MAKRRKAATRKVAKATSKKAKEKSVQTTDYRHSEKKRPNIPLAKIAGEGRVPKVGKVQYYYNPHLPPTLRFDATGETDELEEIILEAGQRSLRPAEIMKVREALHHYEPWLEWTEKRERYATRLFEVDPVALHIHERVSAQAIVRTAMRQDVQRDLFADPQQPYQQAIQFYQHAVDWANRIILGDSLQIMSSLARRENLAGQIQMIYIDPPYGVKFSSNFQPTLRNREVKDRDERDLTREAETVHAYRDTWRLGSHSYLSYLHHRLVVARELLSETGSIFVQIGDEQIHRVRSVMDEIFGAGNFVVIITVKKKSSTSPTASVADYLLWYAKDKSRAKIRKLTVPKGEPADADKFRRLELTSGERVLASLVDPELRATLSDRYLRDDYPIVSQDYSKTRSGSVVVQGRSVSPGPNKHWRHDPVAGMRRLELVDRLRAGEKTAFGVEYWGDSGKGTLSNVWDDTHGEAQPIYVVQTNRRIVERCLLMTTDPGDLVLDPTCGSGTTAYVSEQWGRRWITIDTTRIAVALTRQRIVTATFDYYELRHADRGPAAGILYKTSPLIQLGDIARNENLDPILERHQEALDRLLHRCNQVLRNVGNAVRDRLTAKLDLKTKEQGKRSVTDGELRRWQLPEQRFEHWTMPFDMDPDWPEELQDAVTAYRKAWRAKMEEANRCIEENAEQDELIDQPEVVKGVVRVSGPFTVEGVRPRELRLREQDVYGLTPAGAGDEDNTPGETQNLNSYLTRMVQHLRADGVTFLNNKHRRFAQIDALFETQLGSVIHAEGAWQANGPNPENTVAIGFGPQYGPVTALQVEELIRSSKRYDEVLVAGFSFDAEATEVIQAQSHPRLQIHQVYIRPDINPAMDGLLKETKNSQLFTVFGQPEVEVERVSEGEWLVSLIGVDIYDPIENTVRSSGADKVAAWFLDSDYDGRCFCITQAFFPDQDAWSKIAKALGSSADEEAFEKYGGTESLPFKSGKFRRIAVKVIDPRGNEVMAVRRLED